MSIKRMGLFQPYRVLVPLNFARKVPAFETVDFGLEREISKSSKLIGFHGTWGQLLTSAGSSF